MTTTLTDPRTEQLLAAVDDVEHIYCDICWVPGTPLLCGEPDSGEDAHDGDCGHPECSMCAIEWERHERIYHGGAS